MQLILLTALMAPGAEFERSSVTYPKVAEVRTPTGLLFRRRNNYPPPSGLGAPPGGCPTCPTPPASDFAPPGTTPIQAPISMPYAAPPPASTPLPAPLPPPGLPGLGAPATRIHSIGVLPDGTVMIQIAFTVASYRPGAAIGWSQGARGAAPPAGMIRYTRYVRSYYYRRLPQQRNGR